MFWMVSGGIDKYRQRAKAMADSDSDSSWNDIIKDWTMVNRFGEVEASYWSSVRYVPVVNVTHEIQLH